MQDHKIIFICGLHRSGTSTLFKCLREHPLISGFKDTGVPEDEGQHLQSVYPSAYLYGGAGKFGFASESHLTEASSLVTQENRTKLFSEWKKHWNVEKPILLEKSPPNLIRTRFLQAMFPNSYFIILMRHPIAVSYATQRHMKLIKKTSICSLLKHWLHCHELFMSDMKRLKNCYVLTYEDFARNTDSVLENVYRFIDVNKQENKEMVKNHNKRYFGKWEKLQKNIFLKSYRSFLIKKLEKRMNLFQYSLSDLEPV